MMMIRLLSAMAAIGLVTAPLAAAPDPQATPKGWAYDIKDGKRVPKTSGRVAAADGSWKEETRKGACTETKEMSAQGELRITRQCDSAAK
jgi:hypothetical protein